MRVLLSRRLGIQPTPLAVGLGFKLVLLATVGREGSNQRHQDGADEGEDRRRVVCLRGTVGGSATHGDRAGHDDHRFRYRVAREHRGRKVSRAADVTARPSWRDNGHAMRPAGVRTFVRVRKGETLRQRRRQSGRQQRNRVDGSDVEPRDGVRQGVARLRALLRRDIRGTWRGVPATPTSRGSTFGSGQAGWTNRFAGSARGRSSSTP